MTPYRSPVHTSSPNQCHSYTLSVFFLPICPGSASLFQAPRHPSSFFYHISSQNLTVITSYSCFLTSFSFKLRNLDNKDIFLVNEIKIFSFLFPPMVYSSVQIIIIYIWPKGSCDMFPSFCINSITWLHHPLVFEFYFCQRNHWTIVLQISMDCNMYGKMFKNPKNNCLVMIMVFIPFSTVFQLLVEETGENHLPAASHSQA